MSRSSSWACWLRDLRAWCFDLRKGCWPPVGPVPASTLRKPASSSTSRNWYLMSWIISRVFSDRKLCQQKSLPLPPPWLLALCQSEYAFRMATWSLEVPAANSLFTSSAISFLSRGMTKGSRYDRPAAMVSTGSRQPKMAPIRIILPILGSTGSAARCSPSAVSSSASVSAPIISSSSTALWMDNRSGGSRALPRNISMFPSCRLLICRQSSSSGVRKISGSWYCAI